MLWHKERREPKTTIRVENPQQVFVWVMPKAYQKVNTIVELADLEVGWMEEVTKEVINGVIVLTVHDVHILEQEVSATRFDFTEDAWMKFAEEFDDDDRLEQVNERLRGCGHSHVNMTVGKSSGDEEMAELFLQNGKCKWFLESRANKRGERQFDYNDADTGLMHIDVPWVVKHDYEDFTAEIQAELMSKVSEKTVIPRNGRQTKHGIEFYGDGEDYKYGYSYSKKDWGGVL